MKFYIDTSGGHLDIGGSHFDVGGRHIDIEPFHWFRRFVIALAPN
jgi:hypothetical protein